MHGTGGGPILPPMEEMESEEGDTLREWRRQYAILLEEKENKEKELLNQIIEEAVEFKNELYRKRILAIDTNKATNREKEKVASIKYGMCCRLNDTGVWDVLKLSGDKRCYNINDTGVWALAQLSPNLRQINLSYCSVSDMGLMTVMGNMKCLQDAKLVHLTRVSVKGFELALRASSDSSEKTQVAQQFQVFAFHRITSNASSSWLQD